MLALKLRKLEIDSRYINNPRIKTVALLKAVRHESKTFLRSVGFHMREISYEKASVLLDDLYGKEKSIFAKTEKFVSVSQLAGEDDRDYLLRVERLSHDAGFDDADAFRRHYCFMLAINGLRDINLRMELMAKSDIDWEELKRLHNARSVTTSAINILVGNFDGATCIKREVDVVYNNTKSSTHRACDNCGACNGYNNNSGHFNNYLGEGEHNACSRRLPGICGGQSHSRRSDDHGGKHESGGTEKNNGFHPES